MLEDLKRAGRSEALSERDVHELKLLVTGNNRFSVEKITAN